MVPSSTEKEVRTLLLKWGFWAVMALMGAGLVSIANRNVYSKTEVDERDQQVKAELRHAQEIQLIQHDQVIDKLAELKTDLADVKKELKTR